MLQLQVAKKKKRKQKKTKQQKSPKPIPHTPPHHPQNKINKKIKQLHILQLYVHLEMTLNISMLICLHKHPEGQKVLVCFISGSYRVF